MFKKSIYSIKAFIIFIIFIIFFTSNFAQNLIDVTHKVITAKDIKVGAEKTDKYFPFLKGKNVAIVANQTSMIGNVHLVDSLLRAGIKIKKIFCCEHGFRGEKEAGEHIKSYIDAKTKLPVISLYGKNLKPQKSYLKNVDVIIFDIQDVGVRFYTYISTLHYVMQACAENNISLLVLDRPNPNGYYIDGPVLEKKYSSFVGLDPIPLVYGMTIAEYACMLNGEAWLKKGIKCDLKYVTVDNYNHTYHYILPVNPSPNLKTMDAIYLYPSLGLLEGTKISVGRGTDYPFQIIGCPDLKNTDFSFTPKSIKGECSNPPYKGIKCNGYNLSNFADNYIKNIKRIYLFWLIGTYNEVSDKSNYFKSSFFDELAGTSKLRQQIINGMSEEDIRKSWIPDIEKFKKIRKKYLLYPDFE
jgi:uncharacterized protein YbbC (DUF1343 family)